MSEFAADKLTNRGSLAARGILTNAQDFFSDFGKGAEPVDASALGDI